MAGDGADRDRNQHRADAQNEVQKDEVPVNRFLFTVAASMVTIGFWGTAVSVHKTGYLAAGLICLGAGIAMLAVAGEWKFRKFWRKRTADKRRTRLKNIESLNRRIKKLERELEREAKDLEKALTSSRKAKRKLGMEDSATADAAADLDAFPLEP